MANTALPTTIATTCSNCGEDLSIRVDRWVVWYYDNNRELFEADLSIDENDLLMWECPNPACDVDGEPYADSYDLNQHEEDPDDD